METEAWYESKMLWVGVGTTLLRVIPLIQEMIAQGPVDLTAVLTLVSGVVIVLLRVWTSDPIAPIEK